MSNNHWIITKCVLALWHKVSKPIVAEIGSLLNYAGDASVPRLLHPGNKTLRECAFIGVQITPIRQAHPRRFDAGALANRR